MSNSHSKTYGINVQRLFALTLGLALLALVLVPDKSRTSGAGAQPEKTNPRRSMGRPTSESAGAFAPGSMMMTPPFAAINVDRTDDAVAANACTAAPNDCSLRGAVAFANLAPGTIINVPAGTYQLTIPGGAVEGFAGNNSIGDLDIRATNTTIIGAGAATTIIQQTQPNDRVLEVNPNLDPNFVTSISGVTITGGRETTNVGGGGIISGSIGNVLTLTDCVISNNADTQIGSSLGGGGVQHVGGTLTVTRCTFSGNTARTSGGGLSYSAGDPLIRQPSVGTLTVIDSAFTNNTANSSAAGGGGLDLFNFNGGIGTYIVRGTSFSGNTAPNARGGAIVIESGPLTLTTSSFSNNSAGVSGGAIYSSGTLSASYSRFVGNSVPSPANGLTIFSVNTSATAENNWWGINTGPSANDFRNTGGTVLPTVYLQLQASASPTTVCTGGTSTITANIKKRNTGADLTVELTGLPAFPATFAATLGSVAGSANFVDGQATATFTAGATTGTGTVDTTADNQMVSTSIQIQANDTADPANQSVCAGGTATFSTTATGPGLISFVWKKGATVLNNGDLGGRVTITSLGNSSTLSISNVQASDVDTYTVEATGSCSTATQTATLSVNAATTTTDPEDQTVCQGVTAGFSTNSGGTGPFSYAWTVDGSPFGGNTTSINVPTGSLSIGSHTVAVTATGACGSASQSATLTVQANTSTTDPADQTVCQGANANFSTTASGTGPFTYSWTVDGSPAGTTSSISVATGSLSVGNHTVSVTTTGTCGSASQSATLTVQENTSTTDPADQTVCQGANANFSTTASGTGPFTYSWTVDGSPAGTTSSISVATGSLSVGNHTVSVTTTGTCGSASQSATLTVQENTSTTDPIDQTVCQGASANFSTTASGTGPFSYAWTLDGSPFGGNTASISVPTGSLTLGNHTVSVTTTGTCGSASQSATLTVQENTSTTDPADQTVCQGANANFSTTASGTGPFTYAWTLDGNPFGGNTSSISVPTGSLSAGNHTVSVTTTGTCGSASQSATLTVNTAPTVTTNPMSQTATSGTVTFTAGASGTPAPTVQWQVSTNSGMSFSDIPGATSTSLTVTVTPAVNGNQYRAVFTNGCGTAITAAATLTTCQPPVITVGTGQLSMWPPNHSYQTFNVSSFNVTATSNCDGNITNNVVIASVTSDELDENPSGGDGNTINDIVIAANCKSVQLRSERDGNLDGRVYTITFKVTDANGQTATATATVIVPHSQGNGSAVNSGPHNTVNSNCP